jgi:hypothetical protein
MKWILIVVFWLPGTNSDSVINEGLVIDLSGSEPIKILAKVLLILSLYK